MNAQIIREIQSIFPGLSDDEINELVPVHKVALLNANETFIKEGQVPRKFGFLLNGMVRYFYTDNHGREFTKMFFRENSFLSSYTAMIARERSLFTIQALTRAEIVEISFEHWLKVKQSNTKWDHFLIAILERAFANKEKRERELLLLDAESRYRIFRKEFHDMENKIRQHLIASYIGITPIALSRIRNKMGLINLC